MDVAKNFAKVTLSQGYEAADTEVDILPGEGERLHSATPYNLVWWNATDFPDPADDPVVEIVRVTDRTDDTLTITRAQEGTAASDHNLAGKTYKMIAGLTAKVINEELVGDVHGSGPALVFNLSGEPILRYSSSRSIWLNSTAIEFQTTQAYLGDFNGEGNSSYVIIDDVNTRLTLNLLDLATTQSQSATGPVGTVVGKLAIRDGAGDIIGYLPIYGSIT